MSYRRRSAPVSTLRARLQQRMAEKNNWERKSEFTLEETETTSGSFSPAALFKSMHRYLLVKITIAVVVVFVAAFLLHSGKSWSAPLLQALRFVVEWDLGPDVFSEKVAPAFRMIWDDGKLPMAKPGGSALPFAGSIEEGFGLQTGTAEERYGMHYGIDLAAPEGTVVRAIHDGRVEKVETADCSRDLYTVVIDAGSGWSMIYRGLAEAAVKEGDAVEPGTELGVLGPPRLYDLPHLHFELRCQGRPVPPPEEWLAQWEAGDTTL